MMDGVLNQFDQNMIVTWGNHEFDKGRMKHIPIMNNLLDKSEFTWLGSNIHWQENGIESTQMKRHMMLQFGDINVGVFSFSTDIAHPEYVQQFDDYASTAAHYVPMLRKQGADFVIGLTHQWLQDDLAMMRLPESMRPDIIFGGHEHYVQTEQVNNRWVLKADADAASAIVAEVSFIDQTPYVTPQVVQLDSGFKQDAETLMLTQQLSDSNDSQYCNKQSLPKNCLERVLGTTQNKLMAEETEIRRFETNLGNTLADMVLDEFEDCGADVVFLNSGSIRLNQNIPAGSNITVKHLEEMFPYPSDLRLIEFERSLLNDVLAHSISSWTANGHWLQIAGFVFMHNPDNETATHIHLKSEKDFPQTNQSTIRAVLPYYLISNDTDHDGYTMLNESMQVECDSNGSQVKEMFTELLQTKQPLVAKRDFRICNTTRDSCQ